MTHSKRCARCEEEKPTTEFGRASNAADGLYGYCKPCALYANREWKYGLERGGYEALLEEQGGVCAICKQECPTGHSLAVDHNHETGEVRGLLCCSCNGGLGLLKDSPEIIRRAIKYLEVKHADSF